MPRALRIAIMVTPLGLFACSELPPDPPPPPTILNVVAVDAVTEAPVNKARILLFEEGVWHRLEGGGTALTLSGGDYRYRIEAPGYATEPRPYRRPPAVKVVAEKTTELRIRMQPTDPTAAQNGGGLRGKVVGPDGPVEGALVVATGARARAVRTDKEGDYAMLGLPADRYTVTAHHGGVAFEKLANVEVGSDLVEGVDIQGEAGGVEVGGLIRRGTGRTTVYMVHPKTGDPIPGLSAETNLGGPWRVAGVPKGTYQVETALELDDNWVQDADRRLQEGPATVDVTATGSASLDLYAIPSVRMLSPAFTETASATPELSWRPVDDADFYVVEVMDEKGTTVFGGFDAVGNPRIRVLPPDSAVAYGGDALVPGARYTWRVYAAERDPLNPSQFTLIAGSERLEGGFVAGE